MRHQVGFAMRDQWWPYPPDVPLEVRTPCDSAQCGRPAELVQDVFNAGTAPHPHDFDVHVHCMGHAIELGWNGICASTCGQVPRKLLPRWVARMLARP